MTPRDDPMQLLVPIGLVAVVFGLGTAQLSFGSPDACGKPGAATSDRSEDGKAVGDTVLGIRETRFTLNGEPTFLLGMSYYGALGAPEDFVRRDLDELKRHGFNWVRVWATWGAFDRDVSAVDAGGGPREPFLGRLKWLVAECDRRGLIVDVTLTRGDAGEWGSHPGPQGPPSGRRDARRRAEGASQLVPRPGERAGRPRCAARAGRGAQDAPRAGPKAGPATARHGLVRGA